MLYRVCRGERNVYVGQVAREGKLLWAPYCHTTAVVTKERSF